MLAGIWGLLSALPQLLSLISNIGTWLKQVSGNDPAGFIVKVGGAFSQLQNAKTQEDYQGAAKALADAIGSMSAK
jgi:hypothetical protein